MDLEIERDEEDLRVLLSDLDDPSEPHPAYWNNFLVRVHERIDAETAPKAKAWWSPSLIWGTLTGVAMLLVVAYVGGIFPFSDGPAAGEEVLADGTKPVVVDETPIEPLKIVPKPEVAADPLSLGLDGGTKEEDEVYSIIMSNEDIKVLDAIQSDDTDKMLEAMLEREMEI